MLFNAAALEAIARGEVTLAFRRWARPTVRAGGTLRTAAGVLAIDSVDPVEIIGEEDAARAGFTSVADALAASGNREGQLYRIAFHLDGADPRLALREQAELSPDEMAALRGRVTRLGDWAVPALTLIGAHEGMAAAWLAEALGFGKPALKARIRRLKELGLTESLETGYRLSPRGAALMGEMAK